MLKAYRIMEAIEALNDALEAHQGRCKHKRVKKEYKGNTGNYDPSTDCYWINWFCPTCLKRWTTDQ